MQKYITCKVTLCQLYVCCYLSILSYKYGLIEADWFTTLGHVLGIVKKKMVLLHPQPVLCGIIKKLCGIRDNISSCDVANNNDIDSCINQRYMY